MRHETVGNEFSYAHLADNLWKLQVEGLQWAISDDHQRQQSGSLIFDLHEQFTSK